MARDSSQSCLEAGIRIREAIEKAHRQCGEVDNKKTLIAIEVAIERMKRMAHDVLMARAGLVAPLILLTGKKASTAHCCHRTYVKWQANRYRAAETGSKRRDVRQVDNGAGHPERLQRSDGADEQRLRMRDGRLQAS